MIVTLDLTREQFEKIDKAAQILDTTVSKFIILSSVAEALEVAGLEKHTEEQCIKHDLNA